MGGIRLLATTETLERIDVRQPSPISSRTSGPGKAAYTYSKCTVPRSRTVWRLPGARPSEGARDAEPDFFLISEKY